MASKLKTTQMGRKEQYERRLANRLALLSEKKTEPSMIEKDPLVKNLRANIKATDLRLKAIAKIEQRTAELAKIKAEKVENEAALRKAKTQEGGKDKDKEKDKGKDKGKEKGRTRTRSQRRPRQKARKKRKRRNSQRLSLQKWLRLKNEAVFLGRAAFRF